MISINIMTRWIRLEICATISVAYGTPFITWIGFAVKILWISIAVVLKTHLQMLSYQWRGRLNWWIYSVLKNIWVFFSSGGCSHRILYNQAVNIQSMSLNHGTRFFLQCYRSYLENSRYCIAFSTCYPDLQYCTFTI